MMDFSWINLLAALGGGIFGAAIGGLPAFIFAGVAILTGTGAAIVGTNFDFITLVAFGPIFGPHIAFGGAIAATAYAKKRGLIDDGKNILLGLAGTNSPAVLLVGGGFGVVGYIIEKILAAGIGDYTDTIALTVIITAIIARFSYGNTGLFTITEEGRKRGRFRPGGSQVWLAFQQSWLQITVISLGASLISAWLALQIEPISLTAANFVGFGISAFALILFQFKVEVPITHHITIIAAIGATTFDSLFIGVLLGILSGFVGEFCARLFLIHGDTHIDPPANAIWIMTTVILTGALLV